MYEVKTEQFSGPMNKLLELIEDKKLEVTQLNLAQVTDSFIKHIESLEREISSGLLSDFILIASRLLLIKSKVILPALDLTEEEEEDILDLEHRLRIYKEFKVAGEYINDLWNKNRFSMSRKLLAEMGNKSFFYPPKGVTIPRLEEAMYNLCLILKSLVPETKSISISVITLQDKIEELSERISKATKVSFSDFKDRDKGEIVVLFLAVLHMLSNKLADVEQDDHFGDIMIKKSEDNG